MNIFIGPCSNRLALKRCLFGIVRNGPQTHHTVVLADPKKEALDELRSFSSAYFFKFLHLTTGNFKLRDALHYVEADRFFVVDPNVIAWGEQKDDGTWGKRAYDIILEEPKADIVAASVYRLPREIADFTDDFGGSLHSGMVAHCKQWPLSTKYLHGRLDYLSLVTRKGCKILSRESSEVDTSSCHRSEKAVALYQAMDAAVRPDEVQASVLEVITNRNT